MRIRRPLLNAFRPADTIEPPRASAAVKVRPVLAKRVLRELEAVVHATMEWIDDLMQRLS
jgi:hypothetical protein